MAFGVDAEAVRVRSRVSLGAPAAASASIAPSAYAAPEDFPELDCVRGLLADAAIDAAEARAAKLGTGADRVLIANGALDEETYLRALADQLGVPFVIGYLTSAFLGWLGLMRRGLLSTAWVLLLTPLHWLLLSLAAWRAFYQLIAAPYAWEKAEHGLAKSSRLNAATTRSLLELERHLSDLERSGNLPAMSERTKDTSSNRRRLPRAAA